MHLETVEVQAFAALAAAMRQGITIWSTPSAASSRFCLVWANKAADDKLGYAFTNGIGRELADLVPHVVTSRLARLMQDALRDGQYRHVDALAVATQADDRTPTCDASCIPISDDQVALVLEGEGSSTGAGLENMLLEQFFATCLDMLAIAGMDGYFRKLNRAWTETLGFTEAELTSRPFIEFVHPDDVETTHAAYDEQLALHRSVISFENRYRCADGTYRWLQWNSRPLPDQGLVIASARDLTRHKELEAAHRDAEDRTRTLARVSKQLSSRGTASLPDVGAGIADTIGRPCLLSLITEDESLLETVVACDADAGVVPTHADAFRLSHDVFSIPSPERDALGAGEPRVVPVDDAGRGSDAHPDLGAVDLVAAVPLMTDGRALGVLTVLGTQHEPPTENVLGFLQDGAGRIASAVAAERLRRRLSAINRELESSNAELEQFAYIASHDLQAPLRRIVGFVQLLEEDYGDRFDEQAKTWIDYAVSGAHEMQTLIADLLDYSRVGRAAREFADVDVGAILQDALENLGPALAESGGAVTHDALPTICADAAQIRRVLENLVGNAVKYRGDVPPRIHVSAAHDDADAVWHFAVRDNGIGIDEAQHEHVFQVFARLHGPAEHGGGTGIGLAICRKIVANHGGRMWVEGAPGHGSTFYFTIPDGDGASDDRR